MFEQLSIILGRPFEAWRLDSAARGARSRAPIGHGGRDLVRVSRASLGCMDGDLLSRGSRPRQVDCAIRLIVVST